MRVSTNTVVLSLAAIFIAGIASAAEPNGPDSADWKPLFDGNSLDGWEVLEGQGNFFVKDGQIVGETAAGVKNSYLCTTESYDDFILELEFKVPERANSGVFLRTSDLKDPVYTGLELQVSNSFGRERLTRGGTVGALYDLKAPTVDAAKPAGQWNTYRITCDDNKIVVVLNGEQIIDMDLNKWTEPRKNADGSKNKFKTAFKDLPRTGHIGFQDHGKPVWYRNVRIKTLG